MKEEEERRKRKGGGERKRRKKRRRVNVRSIDWKTDIKVILNQFFNFFIGSYLKYFVNST